MASQKDFLLTALFSLLVLTAFIDNTQSASCCLRYVRRPIPCRPMVGYTIQTINNACDIEAIIFHLPGRFVCANPSQSWTQRGMACLDERRRKMAEIIEETTQANTTSA
ncbi:C-C motif chemokine 20b [Acanthopagrus latus]|uniref:C-C motif chemokine 20b n=1 Tax=Acanthopagrus latus TaxID=8177 RepID=UPI00187C0F60|nr:C-C motif chemokine 20b [Acanthopagrus latus]